MQKTPHLEKLERELSLVLPAALALTITNDTEQAQAASLLTSINRYKDFLTAEKEKITKPLNSALSAARLLFKPIETKLIEAVTALRDGMSEYQTEQLRMFEDEQKKIADKLATGKLSLDTALKKMSAVPSPDDTVGSTKFRPTQRLKITDPTVIPREYLMVDERLLLEALKAGTKVIGAEIEIIQVPVNYRKQ